MENRSSSVLLTKEVARQAVNITMPAIEQFLQGSIPKRGDLHLVVLDPTVPYQPEPKDLFAEAILHEYWFGDPGQWKFPFRDFARDKAKLSWRTGYSSRHIQQTCPALYTAIDIKYGGSIVYNGIIVAASGVEPYFDEMIADWVAITCWGLCMHQMPNILASEFPYVLEALLAGQKETVR